MTLITHFTCCHQYKGYWRSCPLVWNYFTVMPGVNLRAGGAHAPEFTPGTTAGQTSCQPMRLQIAALYSRTPDLKWTDSTSAVHFCTHLTITFIKKLVF